MPAAVQLPSREEWVEPEGMDPYMYSEAELLAEYKAAFGLDNADAVEAGADFRYPTVERSASGRQAARRDARIRQDVRRARIRLCQYP